MADVLSQNEIDDLLKALSSGEVDVDEMKDTKRNQSRITILRGRQNFRKSIFGRWRLFLNIMAGCYLQIYRCTSGKIYK